jgi:hypothetical protein
VRVPRGFDLVALTAATTVVAGLLVGVEFAVRGSVATGHLVLLAGGLAAGAVTVAAALRTATSGHGFTIGPIGLSVGVRGWSATVPWYVVRWAALVERRHACILLLGLTDATVLSEAPAPMRWFSAACRFGLRLEGPVLAVDASRCPGGADAVERLLHGEAPWLRVQRLSPRSPGRE